MKNICVPILSLFISFSPILANENRDSLDIRFHQGRSVLEAGYAENETGLRLLDSISSLGDSRIRNISITGAASPEGSVVLNERLSNDRAERIVEMFNKAFPKKKEEDYNITVSGRDWPRLLELTSKDSAVPFKKDTEILLLSIVEKIRVIGKEQESDHFLEELQNLHGGVPYKYLYEKIFPSLRDARVVFDYIVLPPLDSASYYPPLSVSLPSTPDAVHFFTVPAQVKKGKDFYMALKTNMLYDVLALPSFSAEVYLGKNYSIVANWTYGWWDTDRTHHYWRAYGGELAVRWWFGKKAEQKPLTGHHLGIYGGIMTYDFEFGGTGYMGGLPHETLWNRSLRMAGVEYGYSLPIGRRINIDFTIGFGYLGGKYIKYIPDNGRYLWLSTHKINWVGPTKAEISLVWLIGNGNFNEHFNRKKNDR